MIARACAIVGRPLTKAEWNTYLPGATGPQACSR
jgi:hypothetical protein